jgi:hypothetical protein
MQGKPPVCAPKWRAARQLYNAILSQGQRRLRRMRADAAWQEARTIPRTQKAERAAAFSALRKTYGFTEAALHEAVKGLRVGWIAEHIEAVLAQTLASRAYRALNRVCLGKAKRVRFKSRGRGFPSIENKRNDTSLRFVLQPPEEGNVGFLLWNGDQLPALIDWKDEVVTHGLKHRIKFARLIQRPASSPRAAGADEEGYRYVVQLALEGKPHRKKKHTVGTSIVGGDLGPSTLALFPQQGEASLEVFCAELAPQARTIRRLQRQMERQRREANPENYERYGAHQKTRQQEVALEAEQALPGHPTTQGDQRAQAGSAPQEPAWPQGASGGEAGQHHHHRKDFLQGMAKAIWQECGTASTRDVCRPVETHRGHARAASWWKSPHGQRR